MRWFKNLYDIKIGRKVRKVDFLTENEGEEKIGFDEEGEFFFMYINFYMCFQVIFYGFTSRVPLVEVNL